MEKLSEAASRVVIARPRRGRGALSAQREEVPLGCNLGKALTISPIAFPRCSRVLRDSHVASLLGMTNLEACQISAIFSKTRKLILDFFSIYVTI
jgi:hypothetical protein